MSDYEFHEKLNAMAAENRAAEEERLNQEKEQERVVMAEKAEHMSRAVRAARIRRRALRKLLTRAVFAVVLCAGLAAAQVFGLIAWQLAIPFEAAVMIWLAFWVGAWCQYRWPKGGFYYGGNE